MKNLLIISVILFINSILYAQDQILGKYLTPKKIGKIEIIKRNNKYYGKIIYLKTELKDTQNPSPALRNQSVVGLENLKDFKFDGKDTWEDGTVYDPENGKTYDCIMTLDENKNLKVRGYVGISLFGRTAIFERIKD